MVNSFRKWFIITWDLSDMKLKYFHKRNLSLKFLPRRQAGIPFIILFSVITCFLIFYFPPTYQISIQHYNFSILYPFFVSIFFLLFFTGVFILRSKKHGFFIGLFAVSYLLLRLNNLTHPLFVFLLIALFLVTEFLFAQSNDN